MVKVYSDNANPSLYRVLIASKYANVAIDSQTADKNTLNKAPMGKLPFFGN